MGSMESITLGQNLKRIRKELGLKQEEIVGQEVTRNLISMIENDKSPMSYKIAQVAAHNMNKFLRERGIEVYVDPDDIMKPERVEAKGQANKYIKDLRSRLDGKKFNLQPAYIEELTNFLNKWKIPEKKVEVYELLGEISYLNGNLEWEYLYLNKALENYYIAPVKRDIYVIGRKLIANCISNEKYDEALTLINLDIMNTDEIPEKYKAVTYYNKALAYKRLKDYDKALEILNKYEDYFKKHNIHALRMALIVKGTCYYEMQDYNKSIDVHKKVIEKFGNDIEEVGLAYSNIGVILRVIGSKQEVIEYKEKILKKLKNLEKINSKYLIDIYSRLGEMHEYLNEMELSEYYYINAINKSIERKEQSKSAKILFKLLNLYNKTNQSEKILLSNSIFKRGFENCHLSNEMKLAFSLVLTNIKLGKEEIASDIITDILKKEDNYNED